MSKVIYDANGKEHRIGNYEHVKNYRKNKKRKLVDLFGGKCKICGYNKCLRNLHFHHIHANEKEFGLSSVGNNISLEKVQKEAKKCILVCSNCHGEIHEGLLIL